jgi:hypothetical protein
MQGPKKLPLGVRDVRNIISSHPSDIVMLEYRCMYVYWVDALIDCLMSR